MVSAIKIPSWSTIPRWLFSFFHHLISTKKIKWKILIRLTYSHKKNKSILFFDTFVSKTSSKSITIMYKIKEKIVAIKKLENWCHHKRLQRFTYHHYTSAFYIAYIITYGRIIYNVLWHTICEYLVKILWFKHWIIYMKNSQKGN